MKNIFKIITATSIAITILATTSVAMATDSTYGAAGASLDENYTIEEMLTYAIQDEYIAQAEYAAIMDEYGIQRPFSNIIKAEATHIQLLLPLFESSGTNVPENDADSRVMLSSSLSEAYAIGVEGEIKNIAMYENFLKEDLPNDIKLVFEKLKAASESHLVAFERSVSLSTRSGSNSNSTYGNIRNTPSGNGTGSNMHGYNNGSSNKNLNKTNVGN